MSEVRIAIVGLGNCASSLVQGLEYYKDADPNESVPGLMHVELGGYHIHDVTVVAAFDVDAKKVGKDVAEAIFTEPNNTIRFSDVPADRHHRAAGPHAGRPGHVLPRDDHRVRRARGRRRRGAARHEGRRARLLPAGGLRAGRQVLRAVRDRRGRGLRQRLPVFIACDPVVGARSSPTPACRSSATTSRARSARRSRTACSRSCSRTAASSSTAPTS